MNFLKYYKKITWLGLLLPMLLLLSACGESDVVFTTTAPSTTTTAKTTTASTTTIATATADPMTAVKTTTTIVPTASVETTTAKTSTTSKRVIVAGTTTTKPRPSYTGPTAPTVFTQEVLHPDLILALNRTVYYTGTDMDIRIENTTDRTIIVEDARAVLKKSDSGEWEYMYKRELQRPSKIEAGGAYVTQLEINTKKSTAILAGDLTEEPLEAGEYKLLWAVDGRWIATDFTVLQRPVFIVGENVRTDMTLELDKTEIIDWREEVISVSLQNTTDQDVVVNEVYAVLKKDDDGKWRKPFQRSIYHPQTLKAGQVYTYQVDISAEVDRDMKNFEEGGVYFEPRVEYKLAWLVDDTWVLSDTFTVKKR